MRRLRLPLTLATVSLCAVVAASPARAAESPSAYPLSLRLDVPLLLISGGLAASFLLMNESAPPFCAPVCDRSKVNPLDRPFAGRYHHSWGTIGDITTLSVLFVIPASVLVGNFSRGGLGDALVVAEAVLVTSSIQVIASYAVGRPRPRVYGEDAPLDERNDANAARSFFSGHVADTLAGTLVASTALRRIGRTRLGWAVLAAGVAGSLLIGVSRVAAGGHFPSDVLVGYAIGTGVGLAIPALHDRQVQAAPLALPGAGGLSLTGRF